MSTAKKPKRGPKGKLNPDMIEGICKILKQGIPIAQVWRYLPITYQTWRNWVNKGETAKTGIYRDFYEVVQQAESDGLQIQLRAAVRLATRRQIIKETRTYTDKNGNEKVMKLTRTIPPDTKMLQFLLQSLQPELFKERVENTITSPDGIPVIITYGKPTENEHENPESRS